MYFPSLAANKAAKSSSLGRVTLLIRETLVLDITFPKVTVCSTSMHSLSKIQEKYPALLESLGYFYDNDDFDDDHHHHTEFGKVQLGFRVMRQIDPCCKSWKTSPF